MKKKGLLWLSALLLMLGVSGCSNDDEFNEPNNSAPEFAEGTGENPRYTGNKTTTSSNGVEITKDAQGSIRWITFTDEEKAPTSATSLFSQYLGCNLEKDYRHYRQENYDKLIVECYQQQYQNRQPRCHPCLRLTESQGDLCKIPESVSRGNRKRRKRNYCLVR